MAGWRASESGLMRKEKKLFFNHIQFYVCSFSRSLFHIHAPHSIIIMCVCMCTNFIFNVSNPNRYDKKSVGHFVCVLSRSSKECTVCVFIHIHTYNIEWVKLNIKAGRWRKIVHMLKHTCEKMREEWDSIMCTCTYMCVGWKWRTAFHSVFSFENENLISSLGPVQK